jgi:hypothetical protein
VGGISFTLSNIQTNHLVLVTFSPSAGPTNRVTGSSGPGGTVSQGTTVLLESGTNETFTATPMVGDAVGLWYLNGTVVQVGGSNYTQIDLQSNADIYVSFISTNGLALTNVLPTGGPPPAAGWSAGPGPWIAPTEGNLTEAFGSPPQATCACNAGGPPPGGAAAGGPLGNLNYSLTYNSADADGSWAQLDAGLGFGWTHTFNTFLFGQGSQILRYGQERVCSRGSISLVRLPCASYW